MTDVASNLEPREVLEQHARAHVESAAAAISRWDVVLRPSNPGGFALKLRETKRNLVHVESELGKHPVPPMTDDPAEIAYRAGLLELGASHRMLRAALGAVSDRPMQIGKLPRIQVPGRQE